MKIKDLNGYTIEITKLNEAIQITRRYKQYEHKNKGFSELTKSSIDIGRICMKNYLK